MIVTNLPETCTSFTLYKFLYKFLLDKTMEMSKIENPVNSDVCGDFLCSPLAGRETSQGLNFKATTKAAISCRKEILIYLKN